jgi:hypothetical protein|tara:strand:+ start:331 stop:438 length:108 start_codon:yes stop_codon:yes gene_type:complete
MYAAIVSDQNYELKQPVLHSMVAGSAKQELLRLTT